MSGGRHDTPRSGRAGGVFRLLGPAIIVASVVLGPGSILSSSRVGAEFGYSMVWVLVLAAAFMVVMVNLAGRIGSGLGEPPCAAIARRRGRLPAAVVGMTVFLIATAFQAGNNLAILSALDALTGTDSEGSRFGGMTGFVILAALNGFTIFALQGMRHLYRTVERAMIVLVLLMIAAFAVNVVHAAPSIAATLHGLIPSLGDASSGRPVHFFPARSDSGIIDPLWPVQALVATTFSVAGAFYQAYLVREKGWSPDDVKRSWPDSAAGTIVLAGITLTIMLTSAAVFHVPGEPPPKLESAADVARQLDPFFGSSARILFALGICAASFSSFLVNAMIGGTFLADGLGLDASMDGRWTRRFTAGALTVSLIVAALSTLWGTNLVGLIVFAQALTVLGIPALALALLYLARRPELRDQALVPRWMQAVAAAALILSIALALRTAWRLVLTWA